MACLLFFSSFSYHSYGQNCYDFLFTKLVRFNHQSPIEKNFSSLEVQQFLSRFITTDAFSKVFKISNKKCKISYFKTCVLVIMLPIVYSLFSIESSSKCGPFSKIPEIQFSYEIVNWTINLLNVKLISSVYKMVMSPTVILIRVQR